MAIRSTSILKSYFNTGDKPTESQFGDLIDSFFHKSLSIPQSSIENLTAFLDAKVDKVSGKGLSTNDLTNQMVLDIQDISNKVDKVSGKELSTNDFTDALLLKLNSLSNYNKPSSEEISYINGLQFALDEKVSIEDAVLFVNGVAPDDSGNVEVENTDRVYDLSETPSEHNYFYFGSPVFVAVNKLENATIDGEGNLVFTHVDKVGEQVKAEIRNNFGVSIPFTIIDADPTALTVSNDGFDQGSYLYLEYTKQIEGISIDEVGSASIGEENND